MKKKKLILIIILLIITLALLGILIYRNINKSDEEIIIQTNERDEYSQQIEIVNDYINIREENDSTSNLLGKVYKGEIYTVLETLEDEYYVWCKIETTNKITGYIAVKYDGEDYVTYLEVKEKVLEENNEVE